LERGKYDYNHFDYAEVEGFVDDEQEVLTGGDPVELFEGTDLVQMPALSESVGTDWVVFEGFFVYVCLISLSHIGMFPAIARMLLSMADCSHLTYPFLKIVPVRACRVEPLDGCGGYISVDGEPVTSGSAFQAVPTRYCATVIGRNQRP
uniref:Polyprotein n=1 Tax=Gongylonema pulchrum TaxID=637853 RepID=A0A183DPU1_9BILA